jgi:hypothetical protein
MKIALSFIAVLVLLVAAPAFAKGTDAEAKVLIDKQKSYFDAIVRKDYKAVDGLLAENYYATYALGIIDRAREMKDIREFPLVSYDISEAKVVFLNKKTGLISFKLHVKVVVDGKDFYEDDFLSCVWTKAKNGWVMATQTAVKAVKGD